MSARPDNVVRFERPTYEPAHVSPGTYQLAYDRHRIVKRFDRDVLEVWFTVKDYGEHFGKALVRYYTIQASAKRKSFTARPGSEFVRDYCQLFGRRPRFDAAPMTDFRNCLIRARVETVKQDYRQRQLPESMRYSIIRELISVEGG